MNARGPFERIVASLHKAALDDAHWPATARLISEISRTKGSALVHGEGPTRAEAEFSFVHFCVDGQHRPDLERRYFCEYWPQDDCGGRIASLPHGQLMPTADLLSDREKKTSIAYNEVWYDIQMQNGLSVRLNGLNGSHIGWNLANSLEKGRWHSHQVELIERLLPHMRQFVCVRHVLAESRALGNSLAELLNNTRCRVIQLDRRARIVAANDPALDLLSQGDGLFDRGGFLGIQAPHEHAKLQRLLARALPPFGSQGAIGSMLVSRASTRTRLVVQIIPVDARGSDHRAQRVAALVLVVDPRRRIRIDPALVSHALNLTPAEGRLAAMLAAGYSVLEIARATRRTVATVRTHLKHIFSKQRISRQTELVRRVLALGSLARSDRPHGTGLTRRDVSKLTPPDCTWSERVKNA